MFISTFISLHFIWQPKLRRLDQLSTNVSALVAILLLLPPLLCLNLSRGIPPARLTARQPSQEPQLCTVLTVPVSYRYSPVRCVGKYANSILISLRFLPFYSNPLGYLAPTVSISRRCCRCNLLAASIGSRKLLLIIIIRGLRWRARVAARVCVHGASPCEPCTAQNNKWPLELICWLHPSAKSITALSFSFFQTKARHRQAFNCE